MLDRGTREEMREAVRRITESVATPAYLRHLDQERAYPYELYEAWVASGIIALPFPERYGGLGGGALDLVTVAEQLSRPSADVAMAFGGSVFCALNLVRKGSEAQRACWLPRLIAGEIRMSISMSEPDAGSDVGAIRTRAVRDGDHYVLNGQKLWATAAGSRDNVLNIYARTDPTAHYREALSLFLVDNDTPGLKLRKLDMLGRRSVGTYEVFLDDVRVPADRLVGEENRGWDCVLSGLEVERVVAAACDCGSARGAIELALGYAAERQQFGRPIGSFQATAHLLADAMTQVEAAWALTRSAAERLDAGEPALREITMAKLFAAETFASVANVGMQVTGAMGYSMEFDMQRYFRDARAATVAAGSSQMQRNLIAGLMGLKVR